MANTKISALPNAAALGGTEQLAGVQATGNVNVTPAQVNTYVRSTFGTGVSGAVSLNVGSAGAPVLFNGAGGTPSSITLTNGTGLPLTAGVTGTLPVANGGTGITSIGAGLATFWGTPSSANLAAAVTDETGTGALVFGTAPTISTKLTVTGATEVASNPVVDVTQTWNNGAVAFTGAKLNVTNTASAATSLLADWQIGSVSQFRISMAGTIIAANHIRSSSDTATITIGSGNDMVINRDAANVLALRNSTAAQNVRVYNTYTDASNYERAVVGYSANVLQIGHQIAGTGVVRTVNYFGNTHGFCSVAGTVRWNINGSGHLMGGADNTYDIGDPTLTRPRTIYAATSMLVTGSAGGIGYGTGAGGTVTQATSRTTGVTINKPTGAITLVSAAGSASWQTFTVTNSTVAATDTIEICQKSGTDLNMVHVTAVAAGSFNISFATTGGTTTEQPVFNFNVSKGVTS